MLALTRRFWPKPSAVSLSLKIRMTSRRMRCWLASRGRGSPGRAREAGESARARPLLRRGSACRLSAGSVGPVCFSLVRRRSWGLAVPRSAIGWPAGAWIGPPSRRVTPTSARPRPKPARRRQTRRLTSRPDEIKKDFAKSPLDTRSLLLHVTIDAHVPPNQIEIQVLFVRSDRVFAGPAMWSSKQLARLLGLGTVLPQYDGRGLLDRVLLDPPHPAYRSNVTCATDADCADRAPFSRALEHRGQQDDARCVRAATSRAAATSCSATIPRMNPGAL